MKLKLILILFSIFAISYVFSKEFNYRNELIKVSETKPNEIMIGVFIFHTECQKCVLYMENDLECAIKQLKKNVDYRLIAIVTCDRDLELNQFIKNYNWKYPVYRDSKALKEQLHLKDKVEYIVLNSDGILLGSIYKNEMNKCERLANLISSHNPISK